MFGDGGELVHLLMHIDSMRREDYFMPDLSFSRPSVYDPMWKVAKRIKNAPDIERFSDTSIIKRSSDYNSHVYHPEWRLRQMKQDAETRKKEAEDALRLQRRIELDIQQRLENIFLDDEKTILLDNTQVYLIKYRDWLRNKLHMPEHISWQLTKLLKERINILISKQP